MAPTTTSRGLPPYGVPLPLLLSPVIAAGLGIALYRLFANRVGQVATGGEVDCVCVVSADLASPQPAFGGAATCGIGVPVLLVAGNVTCDAQAPLARVPVSSLKKGLHVASAVTICFARGVNDTPKLAALLIAAKAFNQEVSIVLVGILMAMGGLVFARKVAETMSQRVTRLDDAQGLIANLATAALVLLASKFGLPVSTTHVSVGSIAGVGASAKTLNWQALRNVMLSWVVTLPFAGVIAWLAAKLAVNLA